MATSTTKNLYTRLLAAQKEMGSAGKDGKNPAFRGTTLRYATLSSVWEACKDALHKNGLLVSQQVDITEGFGPVLNTVIYDMEGCSIESSIPIVGATDMQKLGSAITYARRYGLSAILSLQTEDDDDGNTASKKSTQTRGKSRPAAKKTPVEKATEPAPSKPRSDGFVPMSTKQNRFIFALYKEKGLKSVGIKALMKMKMDIDSHKDMSISMAGEWIEVLQNMSPKDEFDVDELAAEIDGGI